MRKKLIFSFALIGILLLSLGSYAYYLKRVNGRINASTGKFVFYVNYNGNTFNTINLVETVSGGSSDGKINPGDKGEFTLDIIATGSQMDIKYDIVFSGNNIPTNMNFYLDENKTVKVDLKDYTLSERIKYASTMTKSHTIYWEWVFDGSTDDDIDFAGKQITLNISIIGKQARENTLVSVIKKNAVVDTNVDFSASATKSTGNGNGINILSGTENNTNPIYYYRGEVDNNNVIFANFCWKIVRTTETGGTKLIYNGVPADGKCNNTGVDSALKNISDGSESNVIQFNNYNDYLSEIGYMHGLVNYTTSQLNEYKNHLEDNGIVPNSNNGSEQIGNKVFSIVGRHNQNAKSSTIKIVLDAWYQNNLSGTSYEKLIEDAIWCNDRMISTGNYSLDNYATNNTFNYAGYDRNNLAPYKPSLTCTRSIDKFTVSKNNGNGDLIYPVGLLTADEYTLTGNNVNNSTSTSYLSTGLTVWTMTPFAYQSGGSLVFSIMNDTNKLASNLTTYKANVRPSISLVPNIEVESGNGTMDNPYIVQ